MSTEPKKIELTIKNYLNLLEENQGFYSLFPHRGGFIFNKSNFLYESYFKGTLRFIKTNLIIGSLIAGFTKNISKINVKKIGIFLFSSNTFLSLLDFIENPYLSHFRRMWKFNNIFTISDSIFWGSNLFFMLHTGKSPKKLNIILSFINLATLLPRLISIFNIYPSKENYDESGVVYFNNGFEFALCSLRNLLTGYILKLPGFISIPSRIIHLIPKSLILTTTMVSNILISSCGYLIYEFLFERRRNQQRPLIENSALKIIGMVGFISVIAFNSIVGLYIVNGKKNFGDLFEGEKTKTLFDYYVLVKIFFSIEIFVFFNIIPIF